MPPPRPSSRDQSSNGVNPAELVPALLSSDPSTYLSPLEQEVWNSINSLRTAPQQFALKLKERKTYFSKEPGKAHVWIDRRQGTERRIATQEGVAAIDEAIQALEQQTPLVNTTQQTSNSTTDGWCAFACSRGLCSAAKVHALDQESSGSIGHTGSDGSTSFERMNRFGQWQWSAGESVDYGNSSGDDIVMAQLIDDGVASRGHRANLLNDKYKVIGIACTGHKTYKATCCLDFAGGFIEKDGVMGPFAPPTALTSNRAVVIPLGYIPPPRIPLHMLTPSLTPTTAIPGAAAPAPAPPAAATTAAQTNATTETTQSTMKTLTVTKLEEYPLAEVTTQSILPVAYID